MIIDKISLVFAALGTIGLSVSAFIQASLLVAFGISSLGIALCLALIRLIKGETE